MQWRWQTIGDQMIRASRYGAPRPRGARFRRARWRPGRPFLERAAGRASRSSPRKSRGGGATPGDRPGLRRRAYAYARVLMLTVRTADCVPALLTSAEGIALLHAGWRGLAAGILEAGVRGFRDPSAYALCSDPRLAPVATRWDPRSPRNFPRKHSCRGAESDRIWTWLPPRRRRLVTSGVRPDAHPWPRPFAPAVTSISLLRPADRVRPDRIIAFASYRPVGAGDSL